MNAEVAEVLKTRLEDLKQAGLITRLVGLVRTMEKNYKVGEKTIPLRVPVEVNKNLTGPASEIAITPDDTQRLIIYFEDRGSIPTKVNSRFSEYRSGIRLVAWYNTQFFGPSDALGSILATRLMTTLLTDISNPFPGAFSGIKIEPVNILPMNKDVFNYSYYSKVGTQFLMHPFGFFAIDLNVNFTLSHGCFDEITLVDFSRPCC